MKTFLFILTLLSSLNIACNNNHKKSNDTLNKEDKDSLYIIKYKINSIKVLYYNYVYESDHPIRIETLQKKIPQFHVNNKGILDAEISDSAKLSQIQVLLESLQQSEESTPINARIVATINYNNGLKEVLTIGGTYTDKIYINGILQKTNNKLLYTIKNNIGFYPWIIGDDMFKMKEMRDNSFSKEPFDSSSYYREYQKILADK